MDSPGAPCVRPLARNRAATGRYETDMRKIAAQHMRVWLGLATAALLAVSLAACDLGTKAEDQPSTGGGTTGPATKF